MVIACKDGPLLHGARPPVHLSQGAIDELGLHRIELHTLPENAPMHALAEASGFMREGVLRGYTFERGRFVDNVVYAQHNLATHGMARQFSMQ